MNREMYMRELNRLLAAVPEHVRAEWLYDYDMHFRMSAERGIPEEQTAMELGDPRYIAGELLLGYRVREAETRQNVVSVTRAVTATLGLGFFNLIFVLGPFFALLAVLIAFWAAAASLFAGALLAVYEGFRGDFFNLRQGFSVALALSGLGIIAGAAAMSVTRGFFRLTLNYLKFNTRLAKGGVSQ